MPAPSSLAAAWLQLCGIAAVHIWDIVVGLWAGKTAWLGCMAVSCPSCHRAHKWIGPLVSTGGAPVLGCVCCATAGICISIHAMHTCRLLPPNSSHTNQSLGASKGILGMPTLSAWQHFHTMHNSLSCMSTLEIIIIYTSESCSQLMLSWLHESACIQKCACHVDMVVGQISENAGA